ncbi:helix-turn-helix transcriptional regulator [Dyadobacter luticola]|uniref:Helix-turn-helix transcriptional regulator n=1 Tax=Dyadobacter luticola TaxID=1979387 RepID=A0A5R9L173_9BACT|nr:AraC family transcriptional regulator [Dyadobacter luticola]TLV02095.1 helix-turn-helix transcriptional regulator [Dyadobacter luticola]
MKIKASGPGMMADFTQGIGAHVRGRFIEIPESKGAGYITGFNWGSDLRMLIRNFYLKEQVFVEWTNKSIDDQKHVVFLLSGIFPSMIPSDELSPERANVLICGQLSSAVVNMPSNTVFGSVTIGVSQEFLHKLFGHLDHPLVTSILEASDSFVFETGISPQIVNAASDMLNEPVPEDLENQYYRLKCEELLCHIFALLLKRDAIPASRMHIDEIKALYAVKEKLMSRLAEPPNISSLAREAGMSEPKLRKLFRQTFGKGVFEFYQSARMQEAARLLKDKHLTVSEVGYQLGFTNLSHFSRVFEEYAGIKPKKYSSTVTAPA